MTYPVGIEIIPAPLEVPQLYFPKGPVRKVKSYALVEDALIGPILVLTLMCGHDTTILASFDPHSVTVRCAYCHFDRSQSISLPDGGRRV